jgi:anoctamin-10
VQLAVPLSRIEAYFGVTVALYFAFIVFYTKMLVVPAAVGLVLFITGYDAVSSQLLFAVTNMLWLTLLLECWKRQSAHLTYIWGTFGTEQFEETRPSHHGAVSRNPVTGRLEQRGSWLTRTLIIYTVSLPIVIVCILLSVVTMFAYLRVQEAFGAYLTPTKKRSVTPMTAAILRLVPSSVYALIIYGMNTAYRWLATVLTDLENHRVQSAYDNHMIVKLALFTLVNSFVSLFYIAFVQQDMQLLRTQLSSLLITTQVINQCQKVGD